MDTQPPGSSGRADDGPEADLYSVLGVPAEADLQQIRRAYRRRVRDSHPDRGGSAAQFQRVRHAFEVLGDDESRTAYDRSLRRRSAGGGDDDEDDRTGWGGYGRGTFTAGTRGSSAGAERTGGHRPSGAAHLPPVYVPDLSEPEPLSLTLTSQRVHGDLSPAGLGGLFSGGPSRRAQRSVEMVDRLVLSELPAARLFHDVSLAAPEVDRRGRPRVSRSAPRAELVLVCGDAIVVAAVVEVPAATASWDGRTLRAAGRAMTVPDVVDQARTLRATLTRRLAEAGREVALSIHGQVFLVSPDGSPMSPVVETLGSGTATPQATARAAKSVVAALAASERANHIDRHLLAALRDQLVRPDD
ncbi:MAG: DnaJ domain-containing protein, partial [Nesterenkonia sp.]|nr:DnaJ domain-containing protein [Nesterenkonia sp.]